LGCEDTESLLKFARMINRSDLEELARLHSHDKLIEFWRRIEQDRKTYLEECSPNMPLVIDRIIRGEFQLALLLIATALKMKELEVPGITDRFKEDEYRLIMDFEQYKMFDRLTVDEIVEFIERREGKVYELVKEYYEKQYNALDKSWGPLLRDMTAAIESRYRDRRRKLEQAAIKYIEKRGLIGTLMEIEEVVKKAVEIGEARREASKEIKSIEELEAKIAEEIESLREVVKSTLRAEREARYEELLKRLSEEEDKVRSLHSKLREILAKLEGKQKEMQDLGARVRGDSRELVDAEIDALNSYIEKLLSKIKEYEALINSMNAEKEALQSRLKELEESIRGVEEGHLISLDETCALISTYVMRVWTKIGSEVEIYNPITGSKERIKSWTVKKLIEEPVCGNAGLIASLEKGLLRKHKVVELEVRVIADWDEFKRKGYHSKPVDVGRIATLVSDRLRDAVSENYYHILVVASPTGFTRKAIEYVTGEYYKRFSSTNLTVYLLDLATGKLYYNDMDQGAASNKYIVEPEYLAEMIDRVVKFLESDTALKEASKKRGLPPHLSLKYISQATGVSIDVVRRAVEYLVEKRKGKIARIDDELVFIYELYR